MFTYEGTLFCSDIFLDKAKNNPKGCFLKRGGYILFHR